MTESISKDVSWHFACGATQSFAFTALTFERWIEECQSGVTCIACLAESSQG